MSGRPMEATELELENDEPQVATVPSTWRSMQSLADSELQTDPVEVAETSAQTTRAVTIETQTEPLEAEEGKEVDLSIEGWVPDADIADFLARVAPVMDAHLRRNAASHAFDDYDILAATEEEDPTVLHVLTAKFLQPAETVEGGEGKDSGEDIAVTLPCTGVSWSSTGSVLCASFGYQDHSGWCTHRAGVGTWNVFRKDLKPSTPDVELDTMSCVMCVACHPEKPSVLAAGTFNGEVVVWDTNESEPLVAQSRIDDYFHREPVTRVEWLYDMFERSYMLASVSADGKVLFWTLGNKLAYPIQGFRLAPSRSQRRGRRREGPGAADVVGGTALAFARDGRVTSSFVVGSEGGGVFKCLIRNQGQSTRRGERPPEAEMGWTDEAAIALNRVPQGDRFEVARHTERFARKSGLREVSMAVLYDAKPPSERLFPSPIDFAFEPHVGPVHSIDCSPFHRSLFLSTGADGRLNIYSMLASRPLYTIEPSTSYLFAGAWSRVRPMVLAVAGNEGVVHVFDLATSIVAPAATLRDMRSPATAGRAARGGGRGRRSITSSDAAVHALSFNPRQRSFLASGDAAGAVRVWKLGWKLSNPRPAESDMLKRFVQSWEDGAADGDSSGLEDFADAGAGGAGGRMRVDSDEI